MSRLAGVSIKTVSRVFNNAPHVSGDIRERVLAAAASLDYHPNVLAQALVRRRSHLIGLMYENPSPYYVVELQRGVLERLQGEPYRLVVVPIQSLETDAAEVVGLLRSAALDAVILAPPASDHPLILSQLEQADVRCARIAATEQLDRDCVTVMDDVAAARDIALHLLGLGHRRIGVIKGDPTHPSVGARLIGYAQAFAAMSVEFPTDLIASGSYTTDSGFAAATRLLDRPDRPTAILAQNDDMAVGAMMAARTLGLSIPGDVSIAGFDDSAVSRLTWPALTTIRQPVFDMAASAADMLIRALAGEQAPRRSEHSHELIVRESTAPPGRA